MKRNIKRDIVITYKNHNERDKRIKDLLARGYTIVTEGEKIRSDHFNRNYKINAKNKGTIEVCDYQSKYIVMRMPDNMYEDLKLKYGGKK